jgi:iron complex transport system substrate-binding protein
MKFRTFTVLLLTLMAFGFPAAAQDTPQGFPLTLIDGAGRELTFDAPPQRVVTYYNDSYGMLATLGLMPVAQSVNPEMLTDPIYFDGQGSDIPTIGYTDSPDLEDVAAAQPDLVLVYSVEEAQALENIAPAFVTYDPSTMDELYEALRQYGRLFAREAEAEAAITAFQNRLAAYQALAPADVSVLKLGAMDGGAFWISTIDDPICQILDTVAMCEWEKATPDEFWGYESTIEGVLALDPDVIMLNNWTSGSREDLLAALDADPLWNELRAVQNGRVLGTPGYENPIASSLPAATKFLDTYLPLLYPDVFPEALTDAQVQEILSGENADAAVDNSPVTVVDGLEREITLETVPERVVLLTYAPIADFAALGIVPVGVTAPWGYQLALEPINFGEAAESFVQVPYGENTVEVVAGLEPDLVIIDSPEFLEALESFTTVYVEIAGGQNLPTVDAYADNVRDYGLIFDKQAEAEALIKSVRQRIDAYAQLSPGDRSISVLYFADDGTVWFPPDCGAVLQMMGPCGHTSDNVEWFTATSEVLLSYDPDVIFLEEWTGDEREYVARLIEEDGLLQALTAVQTDSLHLVPVNNLRFQNWIGLGRALDVIMPLAYPEVFPAPLTDEQVQEILAGAS